MNKISYRSAHWIRHDLYNILRPVYTAAQRRLEDLHPCEILSKHYVPEETRELFQTALNAKDLGPHIRNISRWFILAFPGPEAPLIKTMRSSIILPPIGMHGLATSGRSLSVYKINEDAQREAVMLTTMEEVLKKFPFPADAPEYDAIKEATSEVVMLDGLVSLLDQVVPFLTRSVQSIDRLKVIWPDIGEYLSQETKNNIKFDETPPATNTKKTMRDYPSIAYFAVSLKMLF